MLLIRCHRLRWTPQTDRTPSFPLPLRPSPLSMGILASRQAAPKPTGSDRPLPSTLEQWLQEMAKAHTLLAQRQNRSSDGRSCGSPAQRCIPDHLSVALSYLSSSEFAAAVSTCCSWHAAGELLSAWPERAPMTMPGAAADAFIHRSWSAYFRQLQRYDRGALASARSLFAVAGGAKPGAPWQISAEQFIPAAACSTRIWRHATEATLGNTSLWRANPEGFRAALMAVAALPRIKLICLASEFVEIDANDAFALLAPKLEALVCPDYSAPQWLNSIAQLTHLRILSVWVPFTANPPLMLRGLHCLEHLSLTSHEDEDEWDDEDDEHQFERRADAFATQLGGTLRTLSVKHALRSCHLSISGHGALFDALTAPPCAANSWMPLPLLTSFNCEIADYNMRSQAHRALHLPSLTALHVVNNAPLAALWPDVARADQPQGTAAELAQAARTLAQLHTLSREPVYGAAVPLTAADLAPLRLCSSLRVLQDFIPSTQLEEVVAALEQAAAAGTQRAAASTSSSSPSAAVPSHSRITRSTSRSAPFLASAGSASVLSSSAPLERICVLIGAGVSPSQLSPLHRLQCLRELVFRSAPKSSATNQLETLLEGIAGHPTLESIQLLEDRYARAKAVPLRLTVRALRALIATPSLVRIDVDKDRLMDFDWANRQVKRLAWEECIALRYLRFHFSAGRAGRDGWARLTSDGNGTFRWVGAEGFGVPPRSYSKAIVGAAVVVGVGLVAEWWRRRVAAAV